MNVCRAPGWKEGGRDCKAPAGKFTCGNASLTPTACLTETPSRGNVVFLKEYVALINKANINWHKKEVLKVFLTDATATTDDVNGLI